jgi:hypothetical protein
VPIGASWRPEAAKKAAVPCGTAEFREETSKKRNKRQSRLAALHKLGVRSGFRKGYFAVQQGAVMRMLHDSGTSSG